MLGSQLTPYLIRHHRALLLASSLMLLESLLSLASPWMAGRFTEILLNQPSALQLTLFQLLLLWAGLLVLQASMTFANRYLLGRTAERIMGALRVRLYDHLQSLPLRYHQDRRRGETIALLGNDAATLTGAITGTLLALAPQLLGFCGALFLIYRIDATIAAVIAVVLPLFFLLIKLTGRRLRPLSRAVADQYAHTFAIADENLQLLPIIKSFTREELESGRYAAGNAHLLELSTRQLLLQSLVSPLTRLIAAAGVLGLVWMGSQRVGQELMSAADLVTLLLYGMLMTTPLAGLADAYGRLQAARSAAERLAEAFASTPEPDHGDTPELPRLTRQLEFRDIGFAYPGRPPLLQDLNLTIRPGEAVAITGANGSGKSTLTHLLARFAEPRQGSILIDGHDIASFTLASLRRQIGLVPQQVLLLNGTIRENIAFGAPGASEEQILSAARQARAFDFIMRLPQQFDTPIGDQGVRLSGGQRQRIALARALLKNPSILVLDEATAMFDPEGEKALVEEFQAMPHQYAILIITHRPASLQLAQRVYRLEDGRLWPVTGSDA